MMKYFLFLFVSCTFSNAQVSDTSTFRVKSDGTADPVVATVSNGDASDIFARALIWAQEQKESNIIVVDSVKNKMIRFHGNDAPIFYTYNENDEMVPYGEDYLLEMNILDGRYTVNYTHNYFTLDGKRIKLNMSDVFNNAIHQDGLMQTLERYELSVNTFLFGLFNTITTPRSKW
ncbi:hypothetical protein [Flavobacterium sp.]|uniref:hypothetical protein n=1 Tax=Flavobacterium sp. TaxID=239 RepID=UPI002617DB21|nr:hypothetical protein [Flavobacterium sp.]